MVQYATYDGVYVKFNCAMYETLGIPCQHALYMLKKKKVMELPEHYILSRWTLSGRYRVGRTDAGTSQTGTTTGRPTQLDLWNLRAAMSKAYEDAKEDPNDIKTLLHLIEQFLEKVSLRRASQRNSDQHQSHVASNEFVPQPSIDSYPQLMVRDPIGPVRTKGRPKIATRMGSGTKMSTEKRRKRSCGYCGELGHISTGCGKCKLAMHHIRGDQD